MRKALANHLINGSGLDKKLQLCVLFFKPTSRQGTSWSLSLNVKRISVDVHCLSFDDKPLAVLPVVVCRGTS